MDALSHHILSACDIHPLLHHAAMNAHTNRQKISVLEAANVFFFHLPSYCPEMSQIEPIWNAVKPHEMPVRSHSHVKDLKSAVNVALTKKAEVLQKDHQETAKELRMAA